MFHKKMNLSFTTVRVNICYYITQNTWRSKCHR